MIVHCGATQCGAVLGEIIPSVLGMRDYRPMWRIHPGWQWVNGVLTFNDSSLSAIRRLAHATLPGGLSAAPKGIQLVRETTIPVRVRCAHCGSIRYVVPSLVSRMFVTAGDARPRPVYA